MWARGKSHDAGAQHGAQPVGRLSIFETYIEGVIHLRSLALAKRRSHDRARLTEQDQCLIDQMRTEIEQHSSCGLSFSFAPGIRFWLRPETIVPALVLDNFSEPSGVNNLFYRPEIPIPAPILVDRNQAALLFREVYQLAGLAQSRGKWFIYDHVTIRQQTGFCVLKMRIVRRCDHAELDGLVG